MKVVNLGSSNSILNTYIAELRDVMVQTDRMRFRKNLERIGQIFAYEISKKLKYEEAEVITPLGSSDVSIMRSQPVIGAILRAALPLHQGLLSFFDEADNAFIAAYRNNKGSDFEIVTEYCSSTSLEERILILADPMLATGGSMKASYDVLTEEYGNPESVHIVSIIASSEGVEALKKKFGANVTLWVGAIDDELTAQAYIVPGLGDAGDLAYGNKE